MTTRKRPPRKQTIVQKQAAQAKRLARNLPADPNDKGDEVVIPRAEFMRTINLLNRGKK